MPKSDKKLDLNPLIPKFALWKLSEVHVSKVLASSLKVRYFPKGMFPNGSFPRVISQVATSQICKFPTNSFPSPILDPAFGLLARFFPQRSAPYPMLAAELGPLAACGASAGLT